ncbi:MAG TPA: SDR family NAD(P)-dependent oxidoreductase [Polyangiaceae bacterium]|nr:SDR family NAD(P)-dependent oxidoreductase [Polyangiaceae bacterium]
MKRPPTGNPKVVVVTGAAGGIGRALSVAFARQGALLELCDLDTEGLAATLLAARDAGSPRVEATTADVRDPQDVEAFARGVHARCRAADVLINNAGVALAGSFLETELSDWKWLLDTNLLGTVHCIRAFVPSMLERSCGGHVLNIASASGFFNLQQLAAYGTTKYAIIGLSEALRAELSPHHIGVTALCPAFVDSGIAERVRLAKGADPAQQRRKLRELFARRGVKPEAVARAALQALRTNPALLPVGSDAWGLYLLKRCLPQVTWDILRTLATRR